jgi:hypothetical protein
VAGILAVWNDCPPEGLEHFERWYNREHLKERVDLPGFRCGRRYEAIAGGDRRFFAFYEVDSPAVLNSAPYLARLENPTPWTLQSMRSFHATLRTVCDVRQSHGDLIGCCAVVLRADEAMAPTPAADALLSKIAGEDGVARAQLWTAADQQTRADTAEMRSRGGDQLIAGACVVECVRRADADRIMALLARVPPAFGISGASVLGIYGLLCIYAPRK